LRKLTSIYGTLGKALLDRENPTKEIPLHWAVLRNNAKIVKRLIKEHRIISEQLGESQKDSNEGGNSYGGILDIENAN
jgi:hypothetical protein